MSCLADCFVDTSTGYKEIRPIANPGRLVWHYFSVIGYPSGSLELRQFSTCECGCDKLIANPIASKDTGHSFSER